MKSRQKLSIYDIKKNLFLDPHRHDGQYIDLKIVDYYLENPFICKWANEYYASKPQKMSHTCTHFIPFGKYSF